MRKHKRTIRKTKTTLKCPQCGGTHLYYENAMITGHKYHCKDCDYIGAFVVEEEIEEPTIKKDPVKYEKDKKEE